LQTALVEDVRVRRAAAQSIAGRVAGPLERRVREPHDLVVTLEAIAAIALVHLGLDLAVLEARRKRDRVEHLLDDVSELALVVRTRLGEEGAPLGNDVAGRSP